jgi:hypothetical protein
VASSDALDGLQSSGPNRLDEVLEVLLVLLRAASEESVIARPGKSDSAEQLGPEAGRLRDLSRSVAAMENTPSLNPFSRPPEDGREVVCGLPLGCSSSGTGRAWRRRRGSFMRCR